MFKKHPGNPILFPHGTEWESQAVFNPTAWTDDKQVFLLYRAEGLAHSISQPTSSIGLAISTDGILFRSPTRRIIWPTEPYEQQGCEDPRITCINKTFYLTYTAYDGKIARIAMAVSNDLINWKKLGLLFPDRGWTKSAVILEQPINNRFWMYFGDTNIWSAYSEDLEHWTTVEEPVLTPREGFFDSRLVEPGPAPVLTSQGLLFIYNSADQELRYAVGQCLFAPDEPQRVIYRNTTPILEPETIDERVGQVPNVVFAEGLIQFEQQWFLYYGMADSRIGVAISSSLETLDS